MESMHLVANTVHAEPAEDDYPTTVAFRDEAADYWVMLSRFSPLTPDKGMIEVLVGDQICAKTPNLVVELKRSQCRVRVDEKTASDLLGVSEYTIDFQVDDDTYGRMVKLLRVIFVRLPGLRVVE